MGLTVAVIPCRAGSRRLPNKNVGVKLCGKLLFEWTAKAALDSGVFDKVVVISNGDKVEARAKEMDGITYMYQPAEVAHPTATSESVMYHVIDQLEKQGDSVEWVSLLQITSPLRSADDIKAAWDGMHEAGAESCLSACSNLGFRWDRWTGWPIDFDYKERPPTTEREHIAQENGAIYFCKSADLKKSMCRLNGDIHIHIMPEWKNVDIDTADELRVAERMMGYE